MAICDTDLIRAWTQVLTLSKLKAGDAVTVLTSDHTHPQTLRCAITAATMMGAVVSRLDLPSIPRLADDLAGALSAGSGRLGPVA